MLLSESFLAPYRLRGDCFPNLLARVVYLGKYCRNDETWTDTVVRVVRGSCELDLSVGEQEANLLFHAFWTMQALPPGRGLWTGGVPGIPAAARFNCWWATIRSPEDWCWTADQLMLGGGVGVGLSALASMPIVEQGDCSLRIGCASDHANLAEVRPDAAASVGPMPYAVDDSRGGWVEALRRTLAGAFAGRDVAVDVSRIRARNQPIKTFGGKACGPGPLVEMLRTIWRLVRGAAGRRLGSLEALDVTNHIGKCIKAGNVRRSALLVLGDPNDQAFRDAKKSEELIHSHRHTSNNSVAFERPGDMDGFDWLGLVQDNATFGDPGFANLFLARKTDPRVMGLNPCFSGDTRIATQYGLVPIRELATTGEALRVTTDTRVGADYKVGATLGVVTRDAAPAFMTSPEAELFELTTQHGYRVRATAYHKFVTSTGFVELRDLRPGSEVLVQSSEGQWGKQGDAETGLLIGLIEADGCLSAGSAIVSLWGDKRPIADEALRAANMLVDRVPCAGARQEYTLHALEIAGKDEVRIASKRLAAYLEKIGYAAKGRVPEVIWRGTRECVRQYLRGLFACDGQINWGQAKQSCSARLSQSNEPMLREVQALLANFGIVSKLYARHEAGSRLMPDGQGGSKMYDCAATFDLVVESSNLVRFEEAIGFLRPAMAEKFEAWRASWKRGPYRETFTDEIVSIEPVGREPVYCTTQPSHHTVIANGLVTGQCGEQFLEDYEACNLAEVFPARFDGSVPQATIFKLVARYCIRQRLTPIDSPKSDEVGRRNMRVGVGLGGICDFQWNEALLTRWFGAVRGAASEYAAELGVARPITTTTVKPSGTVSLLCGSSPGIHAPYAEHYLRRIRLDRDEAIAAALTEAGVPFEVAADDDKGRTLVFEFPMKAAHTRHTALTETEEDQLERQRSVQESWADNAVSATIGFDREHPERLARALAKHAPFLKSTSFLSRSHGYVQAPLEEISQGEYERRRGTINDAHPLTRGALEIEECSGGACGIENSQEV